MKAVRYAGAAVCLALAAYFMAPLVMGILHIGMVYPAALLALAAAMLLRPRWFRRLPQNRTFDRAMIFQYKEGIGAEIHIK